MQVASVYINLGVGNVTVASGDITFGAAAGVGVVSFHTLNGSWPGPTSFAGASYFAPTFDNATNMGSAAQLADIKAQIDAWKAANNIGELRAAGISGGSFTGLAMAAAYPGYFARMSLWLILYDLVAWSAEATGGDLSTLQGGMGGAFASVSRPYFERSPRWTMDNIGTSQIEIVLNAGLQDNVTPIHHAREAYRRLKGLPGVTVSLNELNIGHDFGSTESAAMLAQLA